MSTHINTHIHSVWLQLCSGALRRGCPCLSTAALFPWHAASALMISVSVREETNGAEWHSTALWKSESIYHEISRQMMQIWIKWPDSRWRWGCIEACRRSQNADHVDWRDVSKLEYNLKYKQACLFCVTSARQVLYRPDYYYWVFLSKYWNIYVKMNQYIHYKVSHTVTILFHIIRNSASLM